MAFELKLSDLQNQIHLAAARWQPEASVLAGLPDAEKLRRLGASPPPGQMDLKAREAHATQMVLRHAQAHSAAATAAPHPAAHDWRNVGGKNFTTPVRDQSSCGSCVAFGTCATVETTARVESGDVARQVDLSEAQLFYCDGRSQGRTCASGWWPEQALPFVQDQGIADEGCYPYTPGDQACTHLCPNWQMRVTRIGGWHKITDIAQMKSWLATRGALCACFTVYADFYNYRSGVYHHVTGNSVGGHCVSVVGYDDAAGCWICKNSWGTGFGEAGFFRIAYGQCGLDSEMWAVEHVVGAKAVLNDTSRHTPALAVLGNKLAIAWAGTDSPSHVNVMTSADGSHFGGKVILGETTIDGPAIAGGGGKLFLAWTGTDHDHHLNVMSSTDGMHFSNKVTLGDTARFGPALAFGNGRVFIAWVGTDSHHSLNVMSSTDGKTWGNKVTLNENSDSQVALCFARDRLLLAWQGTDSNSSLNLLESTDGTHWTNKVTLHDSSDLTPALAQQGGELVLGWTGRDGRHSLNTMVSTSGTHGFGHKIVYDDTAVAGVGLATLGGHIYVSWSGTDSSHHLNVMRLAL